MDIGNDEAVARQAPVRRLVFMVLLLATKDRATEVRFEPSEADSAWKLRYKVGGCWYDMAPVPLEVPIAQEIRHMAGLRLASVWQRLFAWGTDKATPDEGTIRLVIRGKEMEITASLHRGGSGSGGLDTVALRLPQTSVLAEQAEPILGEYLRKYRHEEERAGGPAKPGAATHQPGD